MRTLKELYQLVLDNFDSIRKEHGICEKIMVLYWGDKITTKEFDILLPHFKLTFPKWYNSKFYWNKSYRGNKKGFWWTKDKAGAKQRKLFLQYLIDKQ